MRPARRLVGIVACGVILAWLAGCAASTRDTAIRDTLTSVDAARVAFVTWDGQHQLDIVKAAPDRSTAERQLTEYRAKQTTTMMYFGAAYRAIAAAATINTDQSLSSMVQTALELYQALKDVGVKGLP